MRGRGGRGRPPPSRLEDNQYNDSFAHVSPDIPIPHTNSISPENVARISEQMAQASRQAASSQGGTASTVDPRIFDMPQTGIQSQNTPGHIDDPVNEFPIHNTPGDQQPVVQDQPHVYGPTPMRLSNAFIATVQSCFGQAVVPPELFTAIESLQLTQNGCFTMINILRTVLRTMPLISPDVLNQQTDNILKQISFEFNEEREKNAAIQQAANRANETLILMQQLLADVASTKKIADELRLVSAKLRALERVVNTFPHLSTQKVWRAMEKYSELSKILEEPDLENLLKDVFQRAKADQK